ncbi:ABC transporter C family member 10-like [Lycium ferocissimum]|uniref:ABC transporter C family member 10-like n=1 Tax=Lycium ferocissimum TaxID=112874 RepID=UPI0028169C5E|nr:ABC transporter C family member 10-like [Lycium ferocissimum]XP_059298852.1 ABC transporter C family member 10-like [Lycium ferocissimum]
MKDLWTVFCGAPGCSDYNGKLCLADFGSMADPSSCINHVLIICFDVILLLIFLFTLFSKASLRATNIPARFHGFSRLQLISAIFNGLLGLVYLGFGIWILQDKVMKTHSLLPLHWWLLILFHGTTWLLISCTTSLRGKYFSKTPLRLLSILAFIFAGVSCGLSLFAAILVKRASLKIALDMLSSLEACLLLLCTYKGLKQEDVIGNDLYAPLNGIDKSNSASSITPFAKAGILSKMSFWWLNPLMKNGKKKTLGDEDIPGLREADRAESCYLIFEELWNKQKQVDPSSLASVLRTILICHRKEIVVSGFFALLKVVTLSAGPLLLNAFIKVAEGNASFRNEGLFLAILLFTSKSLESLSQRQWYFRSRLIGLKVRSLLTAAIYRKQIRLSNAAKLIHSSGEIMNYVTVDAYRIGEFPFWLHQTWTTTVQLSLVLILLFRTVGLATVASLVVIILTVLCNTPLAKLQHKFQTNLMVAQDDRLKAISEALVSMKVLRLYAWESHFKNVIQILRQVEEKWLSAVQLRRSYNSFLFWSSPVLVSAATFGTCYFLGIPLNASNVFTFVATLRLVQEPVRTIPDVIGVVIQAKVSFERIVKFLEASELEMANLRRDHIRSTDHAVLIKSANLSWEENPSRPTLRNINLEVKPGEKVAICGEVGSGKSTLLSTILGEVPSIQGTVQVYGTTAYVSQSAWIQTGTIRENILFGSPLDSQRYQQTLEKCSLLKDLELLPYGDLTEIGERGVNLSGGQKQRIQLARALYHDADIYLLDDPFSAVDAHTSTSLFNEYIMGALSGKTILLVTHQVDFLPAFDMVLLMSDGEILRSASYDQLLASSKEFQDLVNADKETAGSERVAEAFSSPRSDTCSREILNKDTGKQLETSGADQLIKQEEREIGDAGFKPYVQYLNQNKGYLFFAMAILSQLAFVVGQILQNSWMAANVENPEVSTLKLISVYLLIGVISTLFLLSRSLLTVVLSSQSSKSLFSQLLNSLFRAPMSFYDSTPLGRILSRVSSDLSIVDLDVPFNLIFAVAATTNFYSNLTVLGVVTWQVLFVSIPMVYVAILLQRYYFASAKELMRINGTTKSFVANHLAESIAGAVTIRAFKEEQRFFRKTFELIDINASPFFHNFAANEWLIQRLETISATVLASSALCMVLLPPGTFSSGFIGMALSYGLSLNITLVSSIQYQCTLVNYIISVERLNQYMHIPSEAPEILKENRPPVNWPSRGKVEIQDLQIRYRKDTTLVLRGISCTIEGGHKVGIVGRTGSGKSTLISALFRLVEPAGGRLVVDGVDICKIGLHDLRSRFGVIPQDPTLFNGTVRCNLDPLCQHTDQEIWEVLGKCQLHEAVKEKEKGLDSLVVEDGLNWSMGQRQLFCLGRALLRKSKILVLDEATASIDNATDMILQKTIRTEFANCTVITVAHRIPTVMDCTMVLAISDGKLVEYDAPMKLMKNEGSLFGQLVKEYWSHYHSAKSH